MADMNDSHMAQPDDEYKEPSLEYLKRAREADESGDFLLSMYLYLAAFQKSTKEGKQPTEEAIYGLKQAWTLACNNKERSLAEYIFELVEPYLSAEETASCADQLQSLAFDKLEEFGLSREELEDMAQMVSEAPVAIQAIHKIDDDAQGNPEGEEENLDYSSIAGYDSVIGDMRTLGFGMDGDPVFDQLVDMLNARHGLTHRPALDAVLMRSYAREDANRFMVATLGELDLPAVHMRMEENFQGMPVLCISTRSVNLSSPNSLKDVFEQGGVLVLEDLDLWEPPFSDNSEDGNMFFMLQLTRGAREAVNLIRSAIENPDVYVFATASLDGSIDEFFLNMLEPLTLVDIDYPDEKERNSIWMDIARKHPSIRSINRADLVRFSANMARYDIYMASREAIEDAYKLGLVTRKYQPVTRDNLFDKLAAYQPLDSKEYGELENEVIRDFQEDLNRIDDILDEGYGSQGRTSFR